MTKRQLEKAQEEGRRLLLQHLVDCLNIDEIQFLLDGGQVAKELQEYIDATTRGYGELYEERRRKHIQPWQLQ